MKIFSKKTCLTLFACYLQTITACFASDCGIDETYHHCFDSYIRGLGDTLTVMSAPDFQSEISNIKRKVEEFPEGKNNQYVKIILMQLDELAYAKTFLDPGPKASLPIEQWKIEGGNQDAGGTPWKVLATNNCASATPNTNKACSDIYQEAARFANYIHQVGSAIDRYNNPNKQFIYTEYSNRKDKWNSYLYDTQFQYFWELVANRYMEENFSSKMQDVHGNEIGFREPPNNKYVLMHPDVGLQYVRKLPQGQQVKPALIIQWLGYQRWGWVDNKVSNLWGVSLVSTLSDNASGGRMGTGVQIQHNNYAIAFTGLSGGVAITLNLKLVDHISTLNNEYVSKLKAPN